MKKGPVPAGGGQGRNGPGRAQWDQAVQAGDGFGGARILLSERRNSRCVRLLAGSVGLDRDLYGCHLALAAVEEDAQVCAAILAVA